MTTTLKILKAVKHIRQVDYPAMIQAIRRGDPVPIAIIREIAERANKPAWTVLGDIFSGAVVDDSLGRCTRCDDVLEVYSSRRQGDCQVRYYRCRSCHHKPPDNRRVVPVALVRRRRKKNRST